MTIKSLLFLLFLYICLVWVGAAYLHSDSTADLRDFGLRWTAVGLIAVLGFIVGAQIFGWWRRWRATAVARPKPQAKPAPVVHEDDAALTALLAEASTALAKAPGHADQHLKSPLYRLPWYLLIGPEGSGKTSTFLNSGVEPQLLAGQGSTGGPIAPTRICNLWLAKNAIFVELSGRAFSGDVARWTQLLRILRGTDSVPFWQRLWGKPVQTCALRGVIGFSDVKEFTGAAADPQRFERYGRNWQERLRAIGEVFGAEFPVYQVITKSDGIRFFPDFFRQLTESETGQVLGCTLPFQKIDPSPVGEVFAEAQAKRLTRGFRLLYHSLAERRLTHLALEGTAVRRPAIYEFPREFKRIRGPLVQFLTDAFRPDLLRLGPVLRGYYLTGVREVEAGAENLGSNADDGKTVGLRDLRAQDATRMFNADNTLIKSISRDRPKRVVLRWSFVSDLFNRIILSDQPVRVVHSDASFERYRRRVFGGVCAFCAALCLAFFISWVGNTNLLHDIDVAAGARFPKSPQLGGLADLRKLETLRSQVERLRKGAGWSLHWGFYTGNAVLNDTRSSYFRQLHVVMLNHLNGQMVDRLKTVSAAPSGEDQYNLVYRLLKTHLMISAMPCGVETGLVSQVLKDMRAEISPKPGSDWEALADRQIDFYAIELPYGNPYPETQDGATTELSRQYLQNVTGIERIYGRILATAEKSVSKRGRLSDIASNYTQVLRGQDEVSPVYTTTGWNVVEKASKEKTSATHGEACVLGEASEESAAGKQDAQVAQAIQRRFVQDYINAWQKFLSGFSVVPYASADDASRKLEVLSSNRSPLLAVFAITANNTNFAVDPRTTILDDVRKKVEGVVGKSGVKASPKPPEPSGGPGDITRVFQPVQIVVPPNSETWVNEKNNGYIEALAHLGSSLRDMSKLTDPAAYQAAAQNANQDYNKAFEAVRQISRGFKPEGLDLVVQKLLEDPIRLTRQFIDVKPPDEAKKINGDLRLLCTDLKGTLSKYPFKQTSLDDASLGEVSRAFAPMGGLVWKFRMESLEKFTVKEGTQWKPKDSAQTPQVALEMLAFLNRAQQLVTAMYSQSANQPGFAYTLRPKLDSAFKDSALELNVDGQSHVWNSVLQKQFTWPAAPGTKAGATARIRTVNSIVALPFASRDGVWGIFRVMGDAEPRVLLNPTVEWVNSHVNGSLIPIQPVPVRVEFADFPGGVDIFNPQFFSGLQCPLKAVQ